MTKKKKACIIKLSHTNKQAFPSATETFISVSHANDYTIKDTKCQEEKQNLMCDKKIILINR